MRREFVLERAGDGSFVKIEEATMGEGVWNGCDGRFFSLDEKGWWRVVIRDDGYVELVRRYDSDQCPSVTLPPEQVARLRDLLNQVEIAGLAD